MKKKQYSILNALVILALAVSLAACGSKPAAKTETPGSNMPDVGIGGTAEKTETVEPDHTAEQSNLQREMSLEELAVYMASVKEQSAALEEKLQQAVSQADLTMAAGERYELWDQTLSHLLEEIEKLVRSIETSVCRQPEQEVTTDQIGLLVMNGLKDLDEVAYIRFASVYRQFKDVQSFMQELQALLDTQKKAEE